MPALTEQEVETSTESMSMKIDKQKRKAEKLEKKKRKREEKIEQVDEGVESMEVTESPEPVKSYTNETDSKEERKRRKAEKKARKLAKQENNQTNEAESNDSESTNTGNQKKVKSNNEKSQVSSASSKATPLEVEAYRQLHKITVSEPDFVPTLTFEATNLPAHLLTATSTFAHPTPIQAQCWPILLKGRDCIAIAETGSGKTLGFLLPALQHMLTQLEKPKSATTSNKPSPGSSPIVLAITPTRELALQIFAVAELACEKLKISPICIIGGEDKWKQINSIKHAKNPSLIIATPGRLLAMIKENLISLKQVSYVVLDEADRMLDMGFEPDIRAIVKEFDSDAPRQTCMFSATWPLIIQKLASEFIRNPVHITIGKDSADELKANAKVRQSVQVCENDYEKDGKLVELLRTWSAKKQAKIIIFVLYKKEVPRVERLLQKNSFKCVSISGDHTQIQRNMAYEQFKNNISPILIATDVAARGLDFPNVQLVLNYTFPLTVEDYIHRIGRTGRGGNEGTSITFFTRAEKHLSGELINVLKSANEPVPEDLLKFGTAVKKKEHSMYGSHFKDSGDVGGPMKASVRVTFD